MSSRKTRVDLVRELFATTLKDDEAAFVYLGCSGVILRMLGGTVAFDVADLLTKEEIDALETLNLLLFTHSHGDHYKFEEALEIVKATGTHIVAEPSVAKDLKGKIPADKLTSAAAGQMFTIGDFKVSTISGIHRGPINLYHVKKGQLSTFHGGDSGYVPLKGYEADIAFLPTGTPSPTASPEQAFKMVSDLKPKVAIAIHGSPTQSKEFQRIVTKKMPKMTVLIPEPYTLRRV